MSSKITFFIVLLMIIALIGTAVSAQSNYLRIFKQHYNAEGTKLDTCGTCHINFRGGGSRNPYGIDYSKQGRNFTSIETLDSDNDGFTNLVEINALTFPGEPNDHPVSLKTQSQGFEAILAITGIFAVIYLLRR